MELPCIRFIGQAEKNFRAILENFSKNSGTAGTCSGYEDFCSLPRKKRFGLRECTLMVLDRNTKRF
jgi:hypothetical protein